MSLVDGVGLGCWISAVLGSMLLFLFGIRRERRERRAWEQRQANERNDR